MRTDGNLLVLEAGNHRIRLIDPETGFSQPFAGAALSGTDDGQGTEARFCMPTTMALTLADEVVVYDECSAATTSRQNGHGSVLRWITPTGNVTSAPWIGRSYGYYETPALLASQRNASVVYALAGSLVTLCSPRASLLLGQAGCDFRLCRALAWIHLRPPLMSLTSCTHRRYWSRIQTAAHSSSILSPPLRTQRCCHMEHPVRNCKHQAHGSWV